MKENNINIEQLFSEKFVNKGLEPSSSVWDKINNKLKKQKRLKAIKNIVIYTLAFTTFVAILIVSPKNIQQSQKQKNPPINRLENKQILTKTTVNKNTTQYLNKKVNKKENLIVQKQDKSTSLKSVEIRKGETDNNQKQINSSLIEFDKNLKNSNLIKSDKNLKNNNLRPSVNINQKEGCSPLYIHLQINHVSSQDLTINYGDGSSSNSTKLTHMYNNPGTYQLIVYHNNKAILHENIEVFETPQIENSVDLKNSYKTGQNIALKTNKDNNEYIGWYIGNKKISNADTTVRINKSGNYNISLVKWNEHQCKDSLFLSSINVVNQEYKVIFPSAFKPNKNGAPDEKYDINSTKNELFFPVLEGVASIKYSIYNRYGVKMFETSDPSLGWNGYYKNKLMPQDVYVWKAEGIFVNGDKFQKMGNLTLVY